MNIKEYNEIKKDLVNELINKFSSDNNDIFISEWINNPFEFNFFTKNEYTNTNHFNLLFERLNPNNIDKNYTNVWMTFHQMQELNKNRDKNNKIALKKGSKSTVVYRFLKNKVELKDEKLQQDLNINSIIIGNKIYTRDESGLLRTDMAGIKRFNVFNIEQFNGIKKEELALFKVNKGIPLEDIDKQFVEQMGKALNIKIYNKEQSRAYYSSNSDKDFIVIPDFNQFKSDKHLKHVLLHELSHATMHANRLDRKTESYAKEEVVAELSSLILSKQFNICDEDILRNSCAYIKNWCTDVKDDKNVVDIVLNSLDESLRISSYIMQKYNEVSNEFINIENNKEEIMEKNINKTLKEIIDGKIFNADQKREIKQGLENGLSIEQVSLYADKKFNSHQMNEIRASLERGLTKEQVVVYADPKYNSQQMFQIRLGLENGLTKEQVKLYADPKFDPFQMQEMRWGFEDGLTKEQVSIYANEKYNREQMQQIRQRLELDLTNAME